MDCYVHCVTLYTSSYQQFASLKALQLEDPNIIIQIFKIGAVQPCVSSWETRTHVLQTAGCVLILQHVRDPDEDEDTTICL